MEIRFRPIKRIKIEDMSPLSNTTIACRLVTARHISAVEAITETSCEIVVIGGWHVVVAQGKFTIGELVLHFEIDSFLPPQDCRYDEYNGSVFLAKLHGKLGLAVHTVKLHGHISQGMVFHIDTFPEVSRIKKKLDRNFSAAEAQQKLMQMDFDGILGIKKWSTFFPEDGGSSYGRPPAFLPSTKSERAQNLDLFQNHANTVFEFSEKLNGVPMAIYHVDERSKWYGDLPCASKTLTTRPCVGISMGNNDLVEGPKSICWKVAKNQEIIENIERLRRNVVILGELCGYDIVSNTVGFQPGQWHFYAISIFDIDKQSWMSAHETHIFCTELRLDRVPVIARMKLSTFAVDIDDLIKKAEGPSMLGRKREGLMLKTLDGSLTIKAVANNWLLDESKAVINTV